MRRSIAWKRAGLSLVLLAGLSAAHAAQIWTDFETGPAHWKKSPWFGWFYAEDTGPGWTYRLSDGWFWLEGPEETNLWLRSFDRGWSWTSKDRYPFLYNASNSEWLYRQDPGGRYLAVPLAALSASPLVLSTDPPSGATGVSTDLERIRVTFDRPMSGTVSWSLDKSWGGSFALWSEDKQAVEIYRMSYPDPLPSLSNLEFTLNPAAEGFLDEAGHALAPYRFGFKLGASDAEGPKVISSIPENNARNVDPFIDTVVFEFNEPMRSSGGFINQNWWPWTMNWSEDGKTCYLVRGSDSPLYGQRVWLKTIGIRNMAGEELVSDYSLQFQTADPPHVRVNANPLKGFYWPYYLFVPESLEDPVTILVEPNNTGTWGNDQWTHEKSAINLLRWRASFAAKLGCPMLVPVFPRPESPEAPEFGGIYVHALDRYSLYDQWAGLGRIDLQMKAMIEDAVQRLRDMGIQARDRVFMNGFSASGAFTSRFSLLHPDKIQAAAAGSPGGWPLAPVAEWQGVVLKYAMGVADIEELTGAPFDLNGFRGVPLFIYVGDADTNDAFDVRGQTTEEKNAAQALINWPQDPHIANRWPMAEAIYDSVGANAEFKVYPGIRHGFSDEIWADIEAFFRAHR